ncbi:hypothetical protein CGMCC3_g3175 [Colletotrichum fructicola]|nr:uncharacterized protein CGMCC3_g3175 [Colletotrichum fructicola]KAE9580822.1 hypothetical protein CGMCC3_g3175 [Colletotrichum fructicola]
MRYQEWLEVSHPGAAPPRPKPVSTPAPAPTRAQGPPDIHRVARTGYDLTGSPEPSFSTAPHSTSPDPAASI